MNARHSPVGSARARARLLLLLAALATAGCTAAVATLPALTGNRLDGEAIRDARYAQNAAIAAGDADGIAAFWTDDVVIRRGLGPVVVGRTAYRELFATSTSPPEFYVRWPKAIDVGERWPLAYESGEWTGHLGSPAAPAIIGGHYAAQWVTRGGRWLIRSEVFVALTCAGPGCERAALP